MAKKTKKAVVPKQAIPRRAIFAMSPQAFVSLFSGEHQYKVVENPIPQDARIVDVRLGFSDGKVRPVEVLIEHPSIPELVQGQAVPYVKPPLFQSLVVTKKK